MKNKWVERVGELTATHRAARAARFAKLAMRKLWQRRAEGYSDLRAKADSGWYSARERAQLDRPARVAECGAETLQISCQGCGQVHEQRSGCRIGLLCVPCRGAIAAAKRAAFRRARTAAVAHAASRGLFDPNRRGGRWTEKLLTLTAPHDPHDSIAQRIEYVLGAWPRFLRKMNAFWKRNGVKSAEWLRVFEWTPGSDELGHPHLHVWILSPFLPRDDVEGWWREALAEQTGCVRADPVIIDLRVVLADGAEHELIKYLTKDITANGSKLAPELYAEVYKALDGQRSTQASRGFMGRGVEEKRACECGCAFPKRVRRQATDKDGPAGKQ
jgi:hypothetical protein